MPRPLFRRCPAHEPHVCPDPLRIRGHRIRVSTDEHGEAWFVVADACAALAESPLGWALAIQREEEHCLLSEEGPGHGG